MRRRNAGDVHIDIDSHKGEHVQRASNPRRARTRSGRIRELMHEGYPDGHGQAGAIAYSETRRGLLSPNPRARSIAMHVHNYWSAGTYLGRRDSRKLANNTYVERIDDESIGVRLHRTYVVIYKVGGDIILNSGGWHSVTTKQRINQLLPEGFGLYSKRYEWFLSTPEGEEEFFDGMTIKDPKYLRAAPNPGFMERQVFQNDGWLIETDDGDFASPDLDAVEAEALRGFIGASKKIQLGDIYGRVLSVTYLPKKTWWGRYSAPGYLDATPWVYSRARSSVDAELDAMYGEEEEEEEEE